MRLAAKRAIVTGAGAGLGRAIAERFAAEGARVAVLDIDESAARAVASGVGGEALGLHADVSNDASVAEAFCCGEAGVGIAGAARWAIPALLTSTSKPQQRRPCSRYTSPPPGAVSARRWTRC